MNKKISRYEILIIYLILKENANNKKTLIILEFESLALSLRKLRNIRIRIELRRRRK